MTAPLVVVPFVGAAEMLARILNQEVSLHLFGNAYLPGKMTTLGHLTEVSGHGYAPKTLTLQDWTITLGEDSTPTTAVAPLQRWIFDQPGAPARAYGYYMLSDNSNLLWVERFYPPEQEPDYFPIVNPGDLLEFVPVFVHGTLALTEQ